LNKLNEKIDKSVCLIKIKYDSFLKCGTGFLVKLPISSNEKPLYGLITAKCIIDFQNIKYNKSFEIEINKQTFEINLNDNIFIFTSELLDITFIQLIDEKYFNNLVIDFLEPEIDEYTSYINKSIIIPQYARLQKSYASGKIKFLLSFNYIHSASTDLGSSGSPLLISDKNDWKVIGIHKNTKLGRKDINMATNICIFENVINTIYGKEYIYDIKKAKEKPRELNDYELNELKKHGIKKTNLYNVYKCPYFKSKNKIVLFYRSNHGWYCASEIEADYKNIEIIILNHGWTFINPYEPIEKIIDNIGKEKLEHLHEVIIMWLKLSEFKYI